MLWGDIRRTRMVEWAIRAKENGMVKKALTEAVPSASK